MQLFTAQHVLPDPERWLSGGGVLVHEGRVKSVLESAGATKRAAAREGVRAHDLGEGVLVPGLVNAHAHLELSDLGARLPGDSGFSTWIGAIVAARRSSDAKRFDRGLEKGLRRVLSTGTTTVGDIDSTGANERTAGRSPARRVVFREVLDAWHPERTEAALDRIERALPRRVRRLEGISAHAPYTTSRALLEGVARTSRRRGSAVATHWAETEEEGEWLERGTGPFTEFLGASPRTAGLELLEEAGLLGPNCLLIHGNHPRRREPARIAASGASLVHCAGTHAFFGRAPFPWKRYAQAGVRIALGTDSLASNEDVDLMREMALVRTSAEWLDPALVWHMGTGGAADALGLRGEVGELRPGARADLVHLRCGAERAAQALEELTSASAAVTAVWIGGRRVPDSWR